MEGHIVAKFGGSSVANAEQISKVTDIVKSNPNRKYIVVSAPGKDKTDREKITDHLFNIATGGTHFRDMKKNINPEESFTAVVGKFKRLIDDLGIEGNDIIADLSDDLKKNLPDPKKTDFYASRGEHYNAKVIARHFAKQGIPSELVLPEEKGFLVTDNFSNARVIPATYKNFAKLADSDKVSVIPGYYGVTESGDIAVFSRGGSDLTGGEVAYAVNASLYENWTDTDGVFQVDPRIIPDCEVIPRLTYKEIRLLSSKGFNIFHFDAMINCKKRHIPINIRNTNNPSAPGTMIVSERIPEETVVGIARRDDIAYLYIEKDGAGETLGFVSNLLRIMKEFGIETYHYPTDKDDISVIFNQSDLKGFEDDLKDSIFKELQPEKIELNYNITFLSPVGIGMKDCPGVIAAASAALKEKNINIEIIDQGPAQFSFHFGVQNYQADIALQALYQALCKK